MQSLRLNGLKPLNFTEGVFDVTVVEDLQQLEFQSLATVSIFCCVTAMARLDAWYR